MTDIPGSMSRPAGCRPAARRAALVAAIYLGTFIATLDISIVNVALPTLQTALGTDLAGLQWVVDSYALCLSAFMLSAGPVGDRWGRKRCWLGGVGLFTIGSALCAAASDLPLLLVGRVVQGIAGAALIPGAMSILTQAFPDPARRAHVIGVWSSFSAAALITGPILGGILVDTAGWPSIFLINLPLGVAAVALGAWGIEETAHPDHAALDPLGQGLSVLALGSLTFGLIAAGEGGWTASPAAPALVLGLAGLGAFLWVEARVGRPILPLALFRDRGFAAVNAASFALGFSAYASVFFVSLFLQRAQGWPPAATGWGMAPQFLPMAAVSVLFGRLAARRSAHRLMLLGYALIGIGMLGLGFVSAGTPYAAVAALLVVLGGGMGLAIPATGAAMMATAPRERTGMASATMNALRQMGMTIGIALLGTLMGARATGLLAAVLGQAGAADPQALAAAAVTRHDMAGLGEGGAALLAQAFAGGFNLAMVLAGAVALLAAILLAMLRPRCPG